MLSALRDAIRVYQSLHVKARILQRDISENNFIITDLRTPNGFTGLLINLDLVRPVRSERIEARHQTRTLEFISFQVLQKVAHIYRYDLKSFFHVLLWICSC